ncbi:hypothetical protein BC835DRAFT_1416476 [Cytidiella melzeri]|nr:hypothetical protein BC835DRAFT_1416476 [Cytidiella melzeri]
MRLWFCRQSDILVTEAFNFLSDHETLAHFFLSQMYAKLHELGYDPTMKPAMDVQLRYKNQWDITLHCAEDSVEGGAGQATKTSIVTFRTRVWRAQQIIDGNVQPEMVVLKDYWVDEDRLREATIRQKMLQDASSEQLRIYLEKCLLTPLYSGDVVIDAVHVPPPEDILSEDESLGPIGAGLLFKEAAAARKPDIVLLPDRTHYRIVFQETAKTIDSLTSMRSTLRAGWQAVGGLAVIHECGWIQRDVSPGNILVVDDMVKIVELEYAQKMNDHTSDSEQLGTACFMSIEVTNRMYEFQGHGNRIIEAKLERLSGQALFARVKGARMKGKVSGPVKKSDLKPAQPQKRPPFRYNSLHDMESLWWVLVHLTLYRTFGISGDTDVRRKAQRDFYSHILTNNHARRLAFMHINHLLGNGGCLHPNLQPIANALDVVRSVMCHGYVENIPQIDHTVATQILPYSIDEVKRLDDMFAKADIMRKPLRRGTLREIGPALPAAATIGGASLDSLRHLMNKKRPWNETVTQGQADDRSDNALEEARERVKRVKNDLEGYSPVTKLDSGQASQEGKGKEGRRPGAGPAKSSYGGVLRSTVALRRSQRIMKMVAK